MYALICLFTIVGFVWMGFLYKVLKNLQRDKETKLHNQLYYDYKLKQLYGKVEKTKKGAETKKTGS